MHIDIDNDSVMHLMNGVELSVANTEKDIGVIIRNYLKPAIIVQKLSKMLIHMLDSLVVHFNINQKSYDIV